ncbi:MAG: TatD family hydrolase [Erysipelotrichaceae bacterium]|nr:TatD family hydrolase [Erysipelotrichaceae bacterium]
MIDTHAHIVCKELYERKEEVIAQAKEAGVSKILIICTSIKEAKLAIALAKEDTMFDVAVGFHPCDLLDVQADDWLMLEELLQEKEVVALGEIGLDYHWQTVEKDIQKEGFIRQIQLANKVQKPILIHMREATQDTMAILKEYAQYGGIIHCFSGSVETAKEAIALGMYISVGGPLTFKNARGLPEVVAQLPITSLFIETDCPYLTPHPHRGKQNEPKYLPYTLARLCEIKQMREEDVKMQMRKNYEKLFSSLS